MNTLSNLQFTVLTILVFVFTVYLCLTIALEITRIRLKKFLKSERPYGARIVCDYKVFKEKFHLLLNLMSRSKKYKHLELFREYLNAIKYTLEFEVNTATNGLEDLYRILNDLGYTVRECNTTSTTVLRDMYWKAARDLKLPLEKYKEEVLIELYKPEVCIIDQIERTIVRLKYLREVKQNLAVIPELKEVLTFTTDHFAIYLKQVFIAGQLNVKQTTKILSILEKQYSHSATINKVAYMMQDALGKHRESSENTLLTT